MYISNICISLNHIEDMHGSFPLQVRPILVLATKETVKNA